MLATHLYRVDHLLAAALLAGGAAATQQAPTLQQLVSGSAVYFVIAAVGAVARIAYDAQRSGRLPGWVGACLSLVLSMSVGFGAHLIPTETWGMRAALVLVGAFAGDLILERLLAAFGKNGIFVKAARAYLLRWASDARKEDP